MSIYDTTNEIAVVKMVSLSTLINTEIGETFAAISKAHSDYGKNSTRWKLKIKRLEKKMGILFLMRRAAYQKVIRIEIIEDC